MITRKLEKITVSFHCISNNERWQLNLCATFLATIMYKMTYFECNLLIKKIYNYHNKDVYSCHLLYFLIPLEMGVSAAKS